MYPLFSGVCSGCCGPDLSGEQPDGSLTRRQLLVQGGLVGAALGAAIAQTPPSLFAVPLPLQDHPLHHDCIIEAPWGLVFRDGLLALLPDCSLRVRLGPHRRGQKRPTLSPAVSSCCQGLFWVTPTPARLPRPTGLLRAAGRTPDRSDPFERRRLMDDWATYLAGDRRAADSSRGWPRRPAL